MRIIFSKKQKTWKVFLISATQMLVFTGQYTNHAILMHISVKH